MSRLIESIKVSQGKIQHLDRHERRMNNSSAELWGTSNHCVDFNLIKEELSRLELNNTYKLRISYSELDYTYSFIPYNLKSIQSLLVIEAPDMVYDHKFENREELDRLYSLKENNDDILITRHGAVCDSYYCNVAFYKSGKWYTQDMPLLNGIKREYLLESNLINEAEIFLEDVPDFEKIRLFNALIEFGEIEFPVTNVFLG